MDQDYLASICIMNRGNVRIGHPRSATEGCSRFLEDTDQVRVPEINLEMPRYKPRYIKRVPRSRDYHRVPSPLIVNWELRLRRLQNQPSTKSSTGKKDTDLPEEPSTDLPEELTSDSEEEDAPSPLISGSSTLSQNVTLDPVPSHLRNMRCRRRLSQIRVKKDQWRIEQRLPKVVPLATFDILATSQLALPSAESPSSPESSETSVSDSASVEDTSALSPELSDSPLFEQNCILTAASEAENAQMEQRKLVLQMGLLSVQRRDQLRLEQRRLEAQQLEAREKALRYVRAAERDRQRVLRFPTYTEEGLPPPKDEYTTEDEIPPYRAQLHRYLDLVSYDERFTPILRVNRYLVHGDGELQEAIAKFSRFNLLPGTTDLWNISHVDDTDYENMIPVLIPESSY